jgi:hypothetical protein
METWAPTIEQHKELAFVIHARFTFLHRKVTDLMLQIGADNQPVSLKEKFLLLGAINSALKVTAEEIKFALDTGILERKPLEINQTLSSSGAPWEGDPQIRAGLIAEIEKQKAEYDANEKALNEAEGKKECNAAADNQTAA